MFLVCDSDWSDPSKFDVQRQAFAFREYLREVLEDKHAVQVAAPPEPAERDEWGDPVKVGVEDWLGPKRLGGYGGRLEQLAVLERDYAAPTREWMDSFQDRRPWTGLELRQLKTHARLVAMMTLLSGASGGGHASIQSLANFAKRSRGAVSNALSEERFQSLLETDDQVHPLEWLTRAPGRRREDRELADLGVEDRDTLEWQIREGYRCWERTPRRAVGQLIRVHS